MTSVRSSPTADVMAEINITPFTDVLLVLLIIFMILAALSTPPGFQKQVAPQPHARAFPTPSKEVILIEVAANDAITIDGKAVPFVRLYSTIASVVARHRSRGESRHIQLVGDTQTSYNAIIKILDAARQAGDEDVGFVIQ